MNFFYEEKKSFLRYLSMIRILFLNMYPRIRIHMDPDPFVLICIRGFGSIRIRITRINQLKLPYQSSRFATGEELRLNFLNGGIGLAAVANRSAFFSATPLNIVVFSQWRYGADDGGRGDGPPGHEPDEPYDGDDGRRRHGGRWTGPHQERYQSLILNDYT